MTSLDLDLNIEKGFKMCPTKVFHYYFAQSTWKAQLKIYLQSLGEEKSESFFGSGWKHNLKISVITIVLRGSSVYREWL